MLGCALALLDVAEGIVALLRAICSSRSFTAGGTIASIGTIARARIGPTAGRAIS
jgi:hypothetical protein